MEKQTTGVLELLLDPDIQKEITRVAPTFNRAELLSAILEQWGGQNKFAKDVYLEFDNAARGSAVRKDILKMIANLISEESRNEQSREVEDMTDDELSRAILSIAPGLRSIKGMDDDKKDHGRAEKKASRRQQEGHEDPQGSHSPPEE